MKKTILFQGDSITDCGRSRETENLAPGAGLGVGYPLFVAGRLLCERPEVEWNILNRGISGNRVVDLYARWKIDALNLRPDILSILIGINDTWHEYANHNGVEVPRYAKVYRELLTWTKEVLPDVKLVLMSPFYFPFGAVGPEWPAEVKARAAIVEELARDFNAILVPCQKILDEALARAPQEHWLRDGVHPLAAGHQLLANAWIQATASIL